MSVNKIALATAMIAMSTPSIHHAAHNPSTVRYWDGERYSNDRGRVSVVRPKKKKKFGKKK